MDDNGIGCTKSIAISFVKNENNPMFELITNV
jgi:hypothetical protein